MKTNCQSCGCKFSTREINNFIEISEYAPVQVWLCDDCDTCEQTEEYSDFSDADSGL